MSDLKVGPVDPRVNIFKQVPEIGGAPKPQEGGLSFGKMVKDVLGEAIQAEQDAGQAIQDFATGNIDDVHDVVMAVGRANMAIQLLVQVRNGVLEAYQELSRISM